MHKIRIFQISFMFSCSPTDGPTDSMLSPVRGSGQSSCHSLQNQLLAVYHLSHNPEDCDEHLEQSLHPCTHKIHSPLVFRFLYQPLICNSKQWANLIVVLIQEH